jgi:hypothetical protein
MIPENPTSSTDSEYFNENGEQYLSPCSSSSGCSAQEIMDIQNAITEVDEDNEEMDVEPSTRYENTKEENILCSFAVKNSLSRSVMEDLIQVLKSNFSPENIKVNYRKMRGCWASKRPIKKFTVCIPTVQTTKLGKKNKKKKVHRFVAFNPAVHDLSEKVDV